MEGGWAVDVRLPVVLCLLDACDEADAFSEARGVASDDGRVLRLPAELPAVGICLEPVGRSEETEPSSGDFGWMPDIRSKVTGRGFVAAESRSSSATRSDESRTFLSMVGLVVLELPFRLRADRGSEG